MSKEEQDKVVGYDRFKQKRSWREKDTGPDPDISPFEIRGESIDFEEAKTALSQKIEVKVKPGQNPDIYSGLSVVDFNQIAGKVDQMFLTTVARLEHDQSVILERLKQKDPDLVVFLQQKDYLEALNDYKEKVKQIMLRAKDKAELEEVAEAFHQFIAKIPLVS